MRGPPGQGSCIDAFDQGVQVHPIDLEAHHDRWPAFPPLGLAAGYRSAHAVPSIARGRPIGALNLLGRLPTPCRVLKPTCCAPSPTSRPPP